VNHRQKYSAYLVFGFGGEVLSFEARLGKRNVECQLARIMLGIRI